MPNVIAFCATDPRVRRSCLATRLADSLALASERSRLTSTADQIFGFLITSTPNGSNKQRPRVYRSCSQRARELADVSPDCTLFSRWSDQRLQQLGVRSAFHVTIARRQIEAIRQTDGGTHQPQSRPEHNLVRERRA